MDEPYRPTVRTQADLEAVWDRLMGPWGFGRRSVWMLRIDAGRRPLPVITEITECDDLPTAAQAHGMAEVLAALDTDDPGGTFAFLLSRPGHPVVDETDRAWARLLVETGRSAGVRLETLHLATDTGTVPLPADELAPRRTA
ncbi:hypothetical protein [Nocardioides aquiterrae]|uniref:Uncharacterized protein n=1 Tax=Nocardioides aquiterrae TaxID=203799 RepID=A0ABP4F047_9ACTN